MSRYADRPPWASARLCVRPMRESDVDALYALLSDPYVMEHLEPPYTRTQTERFLREAGLTALPLIYGVEDRSGRMIGYVIYHPYDEVGGVELGWVLAPSEWGKGYADELTRTLLYVAGKEYVYAIIECVPEQEATKRIARKNGFWYLGVKDGLEQYKRLLHRNIQTE